MLSLITPHPLPGKTSHCWWKLLQPDLLIDLVYSVLWKSITIVLTLVMCLLDSYWRRDCRLEKSKEKVRVVLIEKKCIDEKYQVKVKEIFLILPFNKSALKLHKTHIHSSQVCQKTRVLNMLRKTQLILWTAGRRGRQNVCVWQTWQGYYFLVFYKKICLKECEVWEKAVSNKVIVTLVTQGLPSSFLSRPVA